MLHFQHFENVVSTFLKKLKMSDVRKTPFSSKRPKKYPASAGEFQ
jgi:hypothetical protein